MPLHEKKILLSDCTCNARSDGEPAFRDIAGIIRSEQQKNTKKEVTGG
jgi:hypothetical protein